MSVDFLYLRCLVDEHLIQNALLSYLVAIHMDPSLHVWIEAVLSMSDTRTR
jgi:hypothetical protein